MDARVIRRTVTWLRDQFAAAAHLHRRPGLARLVRIDVPADPAGRRAGTSVADARWIRRAERPGRILVCGARRGDEATYGGASANAKRSAQLLAIQLAALRWLELKVAEAPRAGDAVAFWLHPDVAVRIEAAGMPTLRHLVDRINGLARSWYAGVCAIGAGKADRIVTWLRVHEDTLGLAIADHPNKSLSQIAPAARAALVPAASDVVPLKKLIVPADLDGTRGRFCAPAWECLLHATNDYDAALAFIRAKGALPTSTLRAKQAARRARLPEHARDLLPGRLYWLQGLSNTQRAYRIEIERFMLWAIVQRKVALSSITFEDGAAYVLFLPDPIPTECWCAPRSRQRSTALWRPFQGRCRPVPSARRSAC